MLSIEEEVFKIYDRNFSLNGDLKSIGIDLYHFRLIISLHASQPATTYCTSHNYHKSIESHTHTEKPIKSHFAFFSHASFDVQLTAIALSMLRWGGGKMMMMMIENTILNVITVF
jgi:hypothetical protein